MSRCSLTIGTITGVPAADTGRVEVYRCGERAPFFFTSQSEPLKWEQPVPGYFDSKDNLSFEFAYRTKVLNQLKRKVTDVSIATACADPKAKRSGVYFAPLKGGGTLELSIREETTEMQGDEAYQRKAYRKAIKLFTNAIEENPKESISLYSKRSQSYAKLQDWDLALLDAEKCLQLDERSVEGYLQKSVALYGKQAYDDALKAYNKGIEKVNAGDALPDSPKNLNGGDVKSDGISRSNSHSSFIQKYFNGEISESASVTSTNSGSSFVQKCRSSIASMNVGLNIRSRTGSSMGSANSEASPDATKNIYTQLQEGRELVLKAMEQRHKPDKQDINHLVVPPGDAQVRTQLVNDSEANEEKLPNQGHSYENVSLNMSFTEEPSAQYD